MKPDVPHKTFGIANKYLLIGIIGLMFMGLAIGSQSSVTADFFIGDGSNLTGTTEDYNYLIYTDGTTAYTKSINNSDRFSSSNASAVFNYATGNTTGIIKIMPGTYLLSNTVYIQGKTTVQGSGRNNTVLRLANTVTSVNSVLHYAGTSADYITIKSLEIDGNSTKSNKGEQDAIALHGNYNIVDDVYIHDTNSTGNAGYGVVFYSSNNQYNTVRNSLILNTTRDGIEFRDTNNNFNTVENNVIKPVTPYPGGQTSGIENRGGDGDKYLNNYINGINSTTEAFGISILGQNITISGNDIRNFIGEGVYDHTADSRTRIINNQFRNLSGNAGYVWAKDYGIIQGNYMEDVYAVIIGNYGVVDGNVINSTTATDGARTTIGVYSLGIDARITNNVIRNAFTHGILLASTDNYVSGNFIQGNHVYSTGLNNTIVGNTFNNSDANTLSATDIFYNNPGKSPFNWGNRATAPAAWGAGDTYYDTDLSNVCVASAAGTGNWLEIKDMITACV